MQSVKNSERIKQKTKKKTAHITTHLTNTTNAKCMKKNEENNYTKNIDNETELFTYTKKTKRKYRKIQSERFK